MRRDGRGGGESCACVFRWCGVCIVSTPVRAKLRDPAGEKLRKSWCKTGAKGVPAYKYGENWIFFIGQKTKPYMVLKDFTYR